MFQRRSSNFIALSASYCATVLSIFGAPNALAQQAAASSADVLETVTISARRRNETLLEAPMSIAVMTSKDLEQRGVINMQDLARFAPGLEYKQMAVGIPGRANTVIQFRGMYTNAPDPTQQVAAQFLDGVYVPDGGGALSLSDVERVEVIRGPQSAVFGRSTFGGAVNYITRNPSNDLRGDLSVNGTDDQHYDVTGSIEGLIAERGVRVIPASKRQIGARVIYNF